MKLQLLVRAEYLPTRGLLKRRPNTFAVVSNLSDIGQILGVKRHRLGRTEVVRLCSSPEWASVVFFSHRPGTEHRISVDVFHTENEPSTDMSLSTRQNNNEQMYNPRGVPITEDNTVQLCGIIFDVETILTNKDNTISEQIPGSKGRIFVQLEKSIEIPEQTWLQFQFRGFRLTNTRLNLLNLERPDFYFEISRKQEGVTQNTWVVVYRSHSSNGTLNPLWIEDTIDLECLCNNDADRELRISILDMDPFGKRTLLGSCETTLRGLIEARARRGNCDRDNAFRLARIRDMKRKEKRGELIVVAAELLNRSSVLSSSESQLEEPVAIAVRTEPASVQILEPPLQPIAAPQPTASSQTRATFDDFVANGACNVEMCVAVDFSTANGDYRVPDTAHFRNANRYNDYQWVIHVVGHTLKRFSLSEEYPMWGFGAAFNGKPYNIFQCGRVARAKGVEGLLEGYETLFQTGFECHSQIHYGEVVRAAAFQSNKDLRKAKLNNRLSYTVLVVITTGSESDLLSARKELELASNAPLSILFIGIDNNTNRAPLSDSKLNVELSNKGLRPLCSFIECQRFSNPRNTEGLSQAVMHYLRNQLVGYFS